MISVNDVTLRLGKKALFEDVNIKFTEGNCYGVIGANGAGKSTFLKVLSGELEHDTGEISMTLSITVRAVEKQIKHLREQGKIIRVGSKKSGHWQVLSDTDVVQGDE